MGRGVESIGSISASMCFRFEAMGCVATFVARQSRKSSSLRNDRLRLREIIEFGLRPDRSLPNSWHGRMPLLTSCSHRRFAHCGGQRATRFCSRSLTWRCLGWFSIARSCSVTLLLSSGPTRRQAHQRRRLTPSLLGKRLEHPREILIVLLASGN